MTTDPTFVNPESTDSYAPRLDALRALAVAGVLITHYLPETLPLIGIPGFVGVRLFFVMSGFLITRILLAPRPAPRTVARAFYMRRFLRIFPLYYAMCALACLSSAPIRHYSLWLFTYSQNFKFAIDGKYPVVAHLWSLAVEEQFYLVWPWIVLFGSSTALKRILFGCIGTAIAVRAIFFSLTGNIVSTHVLPFACLDTLGCGAMLALAHSRGAYPRLGNWQAAALYGAFSLLVFASVWPQLGWLLHVIGETILAIAFADLVGRMTSPEARTRRADLLDNPTLQHLGKISYGIYVIHFFVPNQLVRVFTALRLPFDAKSSLIASLSALLTVVLAELSWRYFEGPLNNLKRRFPYQKAAPTRAR